MNIRTKAEPGQKIFFLLKSQVVSTEVQCVNIHAFKTGHEAGVSSSGTNIVYKTSFGEVKENNVYLSREELANAILEGKI